MDADAFFVEKGAVDAARYLVSTIKHADLFLYRVTGVCSPTPASTCDDAAATLLIKRVVRCLEVTA
jgi:hypothetical protein